MNVKQHDEQESDLPDELSQPAWRALTGAGYWRLEQLTESSEAEIKKLHGMGQKGIDQLRRALSAKDLSFAGRKGKKPSDTIQ
jgi:hypothetical protein